jgi:serine/threonine protein kinase
MNAEFQEIKSIFLSALEQPAGERRAAFLEAACAGESPRRGQVEALLAAHQATECLLDTPLFPEPPVGDRFTHEGPGSQIGPYTLVETIGEGGMGVVYLAEQHRPVQRQVALKIIKPGMDTRQVVTRFEAERQALALMDHPNIARVLDAGATEAGRPYFVMDLVRGVSITEYADAHRLSTRDRLQLFITICQAVQHAHRKGIIHRDLKPSNILISQREGQAVPKIIDFGIAKAVGQESAQQGTTTGLGFMLGTPQYMSPEQAACGTMGGTLDVDTRSDVYSLGAVLYELLTGTPPLAVEAVREAPFEKLQQLIRDEDPPRPSDRIDTLADQTETIAQRRNSEQRQLVRALRGELDWIVMKALAKDRSRRYESPAELARDIERYLRHEPVLAGPPSLRYRLTKLVRRHRGAVVAGGVVLLVLIGGIVGTTIGLFRALDAEQVAIDGRADAIEARNAETAARRAVEAAHARTQRALDTLTDNAIGRMLGQQPQFGPDERRFLRQIERHYQALADAQGSTESALSNQAIGNLRVAQLRRKLGDLAGAERCARKAVALYEQLVVDFPSEAGHRRGLANAQNDLGMMVHDLGQLAQAVKAYRTALGIWNELEADDERHLSPLHILWAQNNLGAALRQLGQLDEAEKVLRGVIDTRLKLAEEHSPSAADRYQLAMSATNLGFVLVDQRRLDEAAATFGQSLKIWDELVRQFPTDAAMRDGQVRTWQGRGGVAHQAGQYDEAGDLFESVVAERRKLAADFPAFTAYQAALAEALRGRGDVLLEQHRFGDADRTYQESLGLWLKLTEQSPGSADRAHELGVTLIQCARLAAAQQRHDRARDSLERAVPVLEKALRANPDNTAYQANYQRSLRHLVRNQVKLRDHKGAAQRALQLAEQATVRPGDVIESVGRLIECAGLAWDDPQLALRERFELALTYCGQAADLLPQAIVKTIKTGRM